MPDFSSLPSVTALASIPELEGYPEKIRNEAAKSAIWAARESLQAGMSVDAVAVVKRVAAELAQSSITRVFNMTGVILHTGLGRAPLRSPSGVGDYQNIEFDLTTGKRGDRQDHVRGLLCNLTGAEDAVVVNNAAAAVFLTLTALCRGKQVLLSRGQSVEIGGSFRLSEIVKSSGCKLVDVGATNKTYASDYLDAITPQTRVILRCHPSNFEVTGFVVEPTTKELADAAHSHDLLMINDQGNGAMIDFAKYGIHGIETLPASVASGADITIGSGDKLLGGPQCGIILGSKELIRKISKHPLARAVRIDKISLNLLEETLRAYQYGALDDIPLHKVLSRDEAEIRAICERLAPDGAEIRETICELGSGAGAGKGVRSWAILLKTPKPDKMLAELRKRKIIGRIEAKAVWLDVRCEAEFFMPRPIRLLDDSVAMPDISAHFRKQISDCWEKWK